MTSRTTAFDIAIIGAGAAGLQLALAIAGDEYFRDHRVLLLDKDAKSVNDRTWCYWEDGRGSFDHLVSKSWLSADFRSAALDMRLDLAPYCYKMIRGLDFYNHARNSLADSSVVTWIQEEVTGVSSDNQIFTSDHAYSASLIFDSRLSEDFFQHSQSYNTLWQHFRGWYVEFESDILSGDSFVMMDFRLPWKDTTSFMYVLPLSSRKALFEYTLFSADLLEPADYERSIRQYLGTYYPGQNYSVSDSEAGVIPMSDYPFDNKNTDSYMKIGTAGGWVKASSGYSFRNAMRNAALIVDNLKNNRGAGLGTGKSRFRYYDSIFLEVLSRHNSRGAEFFTQMYRNNSPQQLLKFLDEDTTLMEEISILNSFSKFPFIRAAIGRLFSPLTGK